MEKDYLSRKLAVILNTDMVGTNIRHYPLKIEIDLMPELDLIEAAFFHDMPKPIDY